MKESLKEPLHILQVLFLFLSWAVLPILSGCFQTNPQVTAFFYLFQIVFMVLAIIFKLIRMKQSNSLQYLAKSQWYFFIPYVLMVSEIYLYVWSIITEQYYFKMVIGTESYGIIMVLLVHFAYSLVCFPHLCSKLEYVSYLSAMVIQLWILILETVQTIGTEKTTTSQQQVWSAIYQQYKDINIAFLALFIGGALIMMDYLNRTQEYQQKLKQSQTLLYQKKDRSHSVQVRQQKKQKIKLILQILQIFFFVVSYDVLNFISWFFTDNLQGQIAIITTTNALALITIILKLLRMWRNNQLKYLLKSQLSFIIPYGMLICQIFLYAVAMKVNLEIINGRKNMQYQVYISMILFYFASSLVCQPQLCSKAEYYSYQLTMAIQVWLVTYGTVNVIGTDQAASAGEIAMDIIMQQVKDLNLCYLALYIGGLLIIMDYLNRTQEEQQNEKGRKLEIQMSNQRQRELQTII